MMNEMRTANATILATTMDTIIITLFPSPSVSGVARPEGSVDGEGGGFNVSQVTPSWLL